MLPELDIEQVALAAAACPRDEFHKTVVLALNQLVQKEKAPDVHGYLTVQVQYKLLESEK